MKYSFKDKNQKITVIGCGYWGTIIAKTLLSLKFKNIYIYDTSYKKTLILKNILIIIKFYLPLIIGKMII